jgi:putative oxidoreductase
MGFPLPAVFAWLAGLSEFAGGLLLALWLMTRPAAPFAHQEKALIFLAIVVTFVCIGAGKYGIDAWVRARTGSY